MAIGDRGTGPGAPAELDDTLAGGGELGARRRAIDWSATPLGPVAGWPLALKTCVRILLTSRQPMWLGWGDELTYLCERVWKGCRLVADTPIVAQGGASCHASRTRATWPTRSGRSWNR